MHLQCWPDPTLGDVTEDEGDMGQILLEILSEMPARDAQFVGVMLSFTAKWEQSVILKVFDT